MLKDDRWNVERDCNGWPMGTSHDTQEWLCKTVLVLLQGHEFLDLDELVGLLRDQTDCPEEFRRAINNRLCATVEQALRQVNAVEEYRLPAACRS